MTRKETIKWLESLKAEIGKSEHRSLWHYTEAIDMVIEELKNTEYIINLQKTYQEFVDIWEKLEVVRCKDCDRGFGSPVCPIQSQGWAINKNTFYCAWGERSE